jgi:hypothetical protein
MTTKPYLLSAPARRIADALLAAYAAPGYVAHGAGLCFDDIQTVAPGVAEELGLTGDNLACIDAATYARLVSLLAARMSD